MLAKKSFTKLVPMMVSPVTTPLYSLMVRPSMVGVVERIILQCIGFCPLSYGIKRKRASFSARKLGGYKFTSYLCIRKHKVNDMPEILRLFGLKFYIYTRDHQPPHIHVASQDGMAKFSISEEIELLDNAGMKSKDLKLAESIIEDNKENILKEWIKIHGK